MRNFAICASVLLAAPLWAQEPSSPEFPSPKAALDGFRQQQSLADGQWIVRWHPATGTPSAIYGTGLRLADWRENSLEEARRHALQLLQQHSDMLGLGTSDFRENIGARMGRSWSLTFEQWFRGVPVVEGRADIRINMTGVVAMMGSRAWPIPANFDTTPAIDGGVATAIAWNGVDAQPAANLPAPRLVIWGDIDAAQQAPFFLAWEVAVQTNGAAGERQYGRSYIDAKTGAKLHYQNDLHQCGFEGCKRNADSDLPAAVTDQPAEPLPVTVTETPSVLPVLTTVKLMAWTRTGADAFSALQNVPLQNIIINVPGIGNRTTDANGEFEIDITSPVTISVGNLDGVHHDPVSGPDAPSTSVTVNPGMNTTIQLLTANATTNQAAHTTGAYWTDRSNEWARSILGNSPQLNTADGVGVNVNINSSCNATYGGNNTNYFAEGGGCANTAFSTVIAHEWGHGLDDRYGGIANSIAEGLSEGWGDIIGMYQVDSPLLGSGFSSPGSPLRNGNNTRIYPYSSGSPHGAGQVWMGFAWRLRDELRSAFGTAQAIAISNDIVIGSIVADATDRVGAVMEVFIADDDDGNLLNGTPHYAQLSAAANLKGIPFPEIQLAVITHSPLTNTDDRLTPRPVVATVTPTSGSINGATLHFDAGAGAVVRNMHPNGSTDGYIAMLPGIGGGNVTYHIEVQHSSGTTVRLPESGEIAYTVNDGSFAGFFSDNFENGIGGWVSGSNGTQNDWQLGNPAGRSGTSSGVQWQDPSAPGGGANCFSNDLGNTIGSTNWNGRYQGNVDNWLRSPVIDCTGRTGVRLRFKRWLSVEEAQFDQATLSVNGQQVWQNPISGNFQDTSWVTVEYQIPWADNNPAVQIEWRLQTDGGLHMGGWNIDDVELGETVVPVADAELTMLPEQAVQGATLTTVITTPGNSRPFIFAVGDSIGPTIVPGLPIVFVGGNIGLVGGNTNASGIDTFTFPAPTVPSSVGLLFYSQVLTFDATFTNLVVSNRHVNLFTQTP